MTTNDNLLPSEHSDGRGSRAELNQCFLLLCLMTGRSENFNFLQLLLTRERNGTKFNAHSYCLIFPPDVLLHPIHKLHSVSKYQGTF